ncbi:MAG: S53 family peptidase, partial [Thermoplasmata archaeon]
MLWYNMIRYNMVGKMIIRSVVGILIGLAMLFSVFAIISAATPLVNVGGFNNSLIIHGKYIGSPNLNMKIDISVALKIRNQDQLYKFLEEVNTPGSPLYMHFLTKKQFEMLYSPSEQSVYSVISYLQSYGIKATVGPYNLAIFADNVPLYKVEEAFHVQFGLFESNYPSFNHIYIAPLGQAMLPLSIAQYVSGVSGLTTGYKYSFDLHIQKYWVTYNGVQEVLGSDLEKAYQAYLIFNGSANGAPSSTHYFPTGYTVATILWEGVDSSGKQVAPFNPSDINTYFKQVVPKWIQNIVGSTPNVTGVPVSGAVPPGPSASNDQTQANYESELDLEMVTTLAPGANVVEVYGPGSSNGSPSESNFPDKEFAAASQLNNLVAVSNSWGGGDEKGSSTTQNYVYEMEATGTTIMASSGDDGDTSTQSYPANDATNQGGFIAVGGTTLTVAGPGNQYNAAGDPITNVIVKQVVWYDNGATNSDGNHWGTTSGTSSVYSMPSWQHIPAVVNNGGSTSGRDVADIAAVGNNTYIYVNGGYVPLAGTSVASPVVAGLIADIVAFTNHKLGFLAPTLYSIGANASKFQYAPYWDVTQTPPGYHSGKTLYNAKPGWDYATGWGSINAYNFSLDLEQLWGSSPSPNPSPSPSPATYTVSFTETGLSSGTTWSVTFNGNTKSSTTSTISFTGVTNGTYS